MTMTAEQYEAWKQAIKLVGGKKIVPIFGNEFVIGREDSDILIPDPSISRRHIAVRQQEDGTVVVTDLGSSHGTLVNAEPLPPNLPRILNNRDRIMVGKVTITFFDGPTFRELVEKVCRKIDEAS